MGKEVIQGGADIAAQPLWQGREAVAAVMSGSPNRAWA